MKNKLLMTTALVGMLFAANPANAFDELNWTWNKTVDEAVVIDVNIASDILPEGHVEIEKEQIMNGDVRAEVNFQGDYLSDDATEVTLNPEGLDLLDQEVSFSGTFTLEGEYDANTEGPNVLTASISDENFNNFDATIGVDSGAIGVQPSTYTFDMTIDGTATAQSPEIDLNDLIETQAVTLDAATELGTLQGAAVAVANFQELETESATYLHDSQIHNALNENGFGVEAFANAGTELNPVEAAVDLSATAISNYMSLSGSVDGSNNVLVADISQETNANVDATATAFQDLSGYNNLGSFAGLDADAAGMVGNLSATAIGNFASVRFGPTVDLSDVTE